MINLRFYNKQKQNIPSLVKSGKAALRTLPVFTFQVERVQAVGTEHLSGLGARFTAAPSPKSRSLRWLSG